MHRALLPGPADFSAWRGHARRLAAGGVAPSKVDWRVSGDETSLFDEAVAPLPPVGGPELRVPAAFVDLAQQVVCHREPARFDLLYRLLVRFQDEPRLLDVATDEDVFRAGRMARAVRRDLHKMTAFVRFREVRDERGREAFVAWFEPEHHIVERVAPFFVARFASMRWSILTPERSMHWDGGDGVGLVFAAGATRAQAPDEDRMEAHWRAYYANIFNPARLKIAAMTREMPRKYWRNLPEASLISPLIADAPRRAEEMVMAQPTLPPERHRRSAAQAVGTAPVAGSPTDIEALRAAARGCRECPLWQDATQTVFGEGAADAPVMFVGEQPGDQEDLAGRPFVGPAGRLFDQCLEKAGIERSRAYVTNAVKHFKFLPRGKRRIHQKPNVGEIRACGHWLQSERAIVRPRLVVALGATALHALSGRSQPLGASRGRILALADGTPLLVTVHPSYLLRLPDPDAREKETARFVAELALIAGEVPEMARAA